MSESKTNFFGSPIVLGLTLLAAVAVFRAIVLGLTLLAAVAVFRAPEIIKAMKPNEVPSPVVPISNWASQIKAAGLTKEHSELMASVMGGITAAIVEDAKMDEPRIVTTADAAALMQVVTLYSLKGQLASDLYPGIVPVSQQVGQFINPTTEGLPLDNAGVRQRVVEAFTKYQEAFQAIN